MTTVRHLGSTYNHDSPSTPDWVAADLYAFQRAVLAAKLPPVVKVLACAIALTTHGATGERATIDEDALAVVAGCSRATLYRHLQLLRGTWLEQTSQPTYGGKGMPKRRARYRLRVPESCLTDERADETRLPTESCLTDERADETGLESRVSSDPESCLTDTLKPGPVLPDPVLQEPTHPSPGPGQLPLTAAVKGGRDDSDRDTPNTPDHRAVVALLARDRAEALRGSHLFRTSCRSMLTRGWTPQDIATEVNGRSLSGSTDPGAILASHVRALVDEHVAPPRVASERREKPSWCGSCDERTRMVNPDAPYWCPTCHPKNATNIEATA